VVAEEDSGKVGEEDEAAMVVSGADSGGYFIEGRVDRSKRRKKNKRIIINKII
jgi:hypothetical protein